MSIETKKQELNKAEREARITQLASADIGLDAYVEAIETAKKRLDLGVIELKQRLAELDEKETITNDDVAAVTQQIYRLRNILLPGSSNTLATTTSTVVTKHPFATLNSTSPTAVNPLRAY